MITIITCGDSNYFEFLSNFEKNIFRHFKYYPIIFDLGLTEAQAQQLNSEIRKISIDDKFRELNSNGHVKTTHKPNCVKNILTTTRNDCLYADADTIFTSKFQFEKFTSADIAITPRHAKERKEEHIKNGLLNAGLIFFKNSKETLLLVEKWIESCQVDDTTDQKALSDILSKEVDILNGPVFQKYKNANISLLDPSIYNDVSCKTGLMLHYKNAGRKDTALKKYRKHVFFSTSYPKIFSLYTKINRIILNASRLVTSRDKRFFNA